jgi:hypothetical protein
LPLEVQPFQLLDRVCGQAGPRRTPEGLVVQQREWGERFRFSGALPLIHPAAGSRSTPPT